MVELLGNFWTFGEQKQKTVPQYQFLECVYVQDASAFFWLLVGMRCLYQSWQHFFLSFCFASGVSKRLFCIVSTASAAAISQGLFKLL